MRPCQKPSASGNDKPDPNQSPHSGGDRTQPVKPNSMSSLGNYTGESKREADPKPDSHFSLTIRGNLIDKSPHAIPTTYNCMLKSEEQRKEFQKLRKNKTLVPSETPIAWLKAIFIDKPGKKGARFIVNGKEAEQRGLDMIKSTHTVSASRAIHSAGQAAAKMPWIGTIDLEAGYYNCKLREDEIYTTVRIEGRVWRMKAPAQGLSGSAKRCCEIFAEAFSVSGAVCSYFDNAIYVGATEIECRTKVLRAIKILESLGFRINRKETIVASKEVKFLGIMISAEGIRASKKDTQKLKIKKSAQGMTSYLDHIFPFRQEGNQYKHSFKHPIKIYTDGCKGKFAGVVMIHDGKSLSSQKQCKQANQQQSERMAYHQGAKKAFHYKLNRLYTDAKSLLATNKTSGFNSGHQVLVEYVRDRLGIKAEYINTKLNPADAASREELPRKLKEKEKSKIHESAFTLTKINRMSQLIANPLFNI